MKKQIEKLIFLSFVGLLILGISSCNSGNKAEEQNTENQEEPQTEEVESDPMKNKGIGPVSSITLEALNADLAKKGGELFTNKCSACHALDKRVVGPPLDRLTERRTPEWIMNMILNPEQMVKEDPIAKELLGEYLAPMANQSLTQDESRAILEYFRENDSK
ncbi:MAG: cytochrome c [Flavobacteriia bacterium]|nr:cytochrome c [Flavobacteriia bacterium]